VEKPQGVKISISIILTSIFLTAIGIASIDLSSSGVIIYAFDQNLAGLDEGNEWVTILNPTNKSVDIGNGTLVQRFCIFHLLSLIVVSGKRIIRLRKVQCFCQDLHFFIRRRGHVY
jgi:hypothetical protein